MEYGVSMVRILPASGSLRSRLRSLLSVRERLQRQLPRRSSKPRIGAYVVNVKQGLRLVVQAGMSDDLWKWLTERGWRVDSYRPDRREYRDIPASSVTTLIDADADRREDVMAEAVLSAQRRPLGRRPY